MHTLTEAKLSFQHRKSGGGGKGRGGRRGGGGEEQQQQQQQQEQEEQEEEAYVSVEAVARHSVTHSMSLERVYCSTSQCYPQTHSVSLKQEYFKQYFYCIYNFRMAFSFQ